MIYQCTIQYDGSKFSGWQKQPGLITVQQTLEEALSIIHKMPVQVHGSGRTDKGVHAYGQVFHFESDLNMDAQAFQRALNALIPNRARIVDIKEHESFHARFDAQSKTYTYRINLGAVNVFQHDYVYQLNRSLDVELMKSCAQVFMGTHDFTSFNATELAIIDNQVRTIQSIDIKQMDELIEITLEGDGFLRYMVRMIVAAMVEVGLHRKTVEAITEILEAKNKDAFTKNVPACGLYLVSVDY